MPWRFAVLDRLDQLQIDTVLLLIAQIHIQHHAGDVSFDRIAWFPRVTIHAVPRWASIVEILGPALVKAEVVPRTVDGDVLGADMVQIGPRAFPGSEIAAAFRP